MPGSVCVFSIQEDTVTFCLEMVNFPGKKDNGLAGIVKLIVKEFSFFNPSWAKMLEALRDNKLAEVFCCCSIRSMKLKMLLYHTTSSLLTGETMLIRLLKRLTSLCSVFHY